jgi:hypothetical protein
MPRNDTNNNNNRRINPEVWVLGSAFILGMMLFGMGLRGCGCVQKTQNCDDCKEKTEISVDGDAIIVNDSQNTDIKVNKGNDNIINDNNSAINVAPKPQPKPQPKPKPQTKPIPVAPAPVVEPKPEPKPEPEPECKTVTTTRHTRIIISGDADDVINAAVVLMNSNCR